MAVWVASLALAVGLLGGQALTETTPDYPPAPPVAAGLWQKAVEIFRSNRDWYPGQIVIVSEVLNGRRQFQSLTEIFLSLEPGGGGLLRFRLDRYLRNGVDRTEEMMSKVRIRNPLHPMAPSEENGYTVSIADSPFNPDDQDGVTFAPREERREIDGRVCRRFDFTFRRKGPDGRPGREMTWQGRAWLEEASGRPIELRFSITPLPGRLRGMEVVYHYETEWPDRWVVKDAVITGSGGFLFIKKYFTVTTTFGKYLRPPAAAALVAFR